MGAYEVGIMEIISILILLVSLTLMFLNRQNYYVSRVILEGVKQAEKKFDRNTSDDLKYDYIVDMLYKNIPKIYSIGIRKVVVDKYISEAFYILKDLIDNGKLDNSYDIEKESEKSVLKRTSEDIIK